MKKIEEVIKALEECMADDAIESEGVYLATDALHYLKKLKRIEERMERIALGNLEDTLSKMDNPPLTWDELKTMKGKPVWIELLGNCHWKGWDVIAGFDEDDFGVAMVTVHNDDYYKLDLGKTWQSYRKERE